MPEHPAAVNAPALTPSGRVAVALPSAPCYTFPVAQVLWMSFTVPTFGLQNYALLFTSNTVATVISVTLRICLICTLVTVVLGYLVAYAMTHVGARHRNYLIFFVALPFWLSVLIRAFAWMMMLGREGPINNVLLYLGAISEPLALTRNEIGVIIGMV